MEEHDPQQDQGQGAPAHRCGSRHAMSPPPASAVSAGRQHVDAGMSGRSPRRIQLALPPSINSYICLAFRKGRVHEGLPTSTAERKVPKLMVALESLASDGKRLSSWRRGREGVPATAPGRIDSIVGVVSVKGRRLGEGKGGEDDQVKVKCHPSSKSVSAAAGATLRK